MKNVKYYLAYWLLILGLCFPALNAEKCEITVFDCAQGNAVVAKYNQQTIIFDAGRKGHAKFVKYESDTADESVINQSFPITLVPSGKEAETFVSVLVKRGIPIDKGEENDQDDYKTNFRKSLKKYVRKDGNVLQAVFISHADVDHYNLVEEYGLKPKAFILGGYYPAYNGSECGKKFTAYVKSCNLAPKYIIKQDESTGYKDTPSSNFYNEKWRKIENSCSFSHKNKKMKYSIPKVKILSANAGKGLHKYKNKDSMVVKIIQNGHSMIISGDAEKETWESIDDIDLVSDFLLISHHGSNTNSSTTKGLLDKVKPRACFISAGFEHHHPSSYVIKLLLGYFETNKYRTTPHFITYFDKKTLKTRITNAPIFTTIDNGCLRINLDDLSIKTSRNFSPTPNQFFSNDEYMLSLETPAEEQKVYTLQQLEKINKGPLKKEKNWDDIYVVPFKGEELHFFKYESAYLQMELNVEEILDDEDDGSDDEDGWSSSAESNASTDSSTSEDES
jgi:beta-lactamase superfamily II metal-dependent hydrolase